MGGEAHQFKDCMAWRLVEAIVINFLVIVSLVVALGMIVVEAIREWFGRLKP